MFSVNLTGANVESPASVAVTIAASDVSNLPALSLTTARTGLWTLARRGFSAALLSVLTLAAFSQAPSVSAAPPRHPAATANGHSEQKAKFRGTLLSISRDGTTVQLNLSGGVTMTLPQKAITVFDERTHNATRSSVAQLAAEMHIIVKTHMDKLGKVTEAKIRITS